MGRLPFFVGKENSQNTFLVYVCKIINHWNYIVSNAYFP